MTRWKCIIVNNSDYKPSKLLSILLFIAQFKLLTHMTALWFGTRMPINSGEG